MPDKPPSSGLDLYLDKSKKPGAGSKKSGDAGSEGFDLHPEAAPPDPAYPNYAFLADRPDDFARVFLGVDLEFVRNICREDLFDLDKRENGTRLVDRLQARTGVNVESVIKSLDRVDAQIKAGEFEACERDRLVRRAVHRETGERILAALPDMVPGRIKMSPARALGNFLLDAATDQPRVFTMAAGLFGDLEDEEDWTDAVEGFQAFVRSNLPELLPIMDSKTPANHLRPLIHDLFAAMKDIYRAGREMQHLEESVAESIDVFRERLGALTQDISATKEALRRTELLVMREFERAAAGFLLAREYEELGLAHCFGAGVFLARNWPGFFDALDRSLDEAFTDARRRVLKDREQGGVRVLYSRGEGGKWKKFLIQLSFNSLLQRMRRLDPATGKLVVPDPTMLQEDLETVRLQDVPQALADRLAAVDYKSPQRLRRDIVKLVRLSPEAEDCLEAMDSLRKARAKLESAKGEELEAMQEAAKTAAGLQRSMEDFAKTLDLVLHGRTRRFLQEIEKRLGEEAVRRVERLQEEAASSTSFFKEAGRELAQRMFLAKIRAMRERDRVEDEPIVRKINELVRRRVEQNGEAGGFAAQIDQFSEVRIRREEGRQVLVEVDIDMLTVLVLLWKPPKVIAEAGRFSEQQREDDMARKRVGFIMGLIIRKIFKYISPRGWDKELRLFTANARRLLATVRRAGDRSREQDQALAKTLEQVGGFVEKLRIIRDVLMAADLVENFGAGSMDRLFKLNPELGKRRHNAQFFAAYLAYASRLGERDPSGQEDNIATLIEQMRAAGYEVPGIVEER